MWMDLVEDLQLVYLHLFIHTNTVPSGAHHYNYEFVFKILKKTKSKRRERANSGCNGPQRKDKSRLCSCFLVEQPAMPPMFPGLPRFWKADEKFYVVFAGFCASKWNCHKTPCPHVRLSHLEGKAMAPRVSPVCNSLPLRLASKDKGKKC
jgi:hypothetical protein